MKLVLSLYQPQEPSNFEMEVALDPEVGAEISEILERVQALPEVKDDTSLALCIETSREVKSMINGIEESREALKKPFLHASRAIDDSARKARSKLGEAYADLMSAAAIYESAQKERRNQERLRHEAELERLAKQAHQEKDEQKRNELIQQAQDAALAANAVNLSGRGMRLTKHYEFILEDVAEVLRFNRGLLNVTVNKLACQDLIRTMKAAGTKQFSIPGMRIVETDQASVSGKSP
jgi:hypothetical protein